MFLCKQRNKISCSQLFIMNQQQYLLSLSLSNSIMVSELEIYLWRQIRIPLPLLLPFFRFLRSQMILTSCYGCNRQNLLSRLINFNIWGQILRSRCVFSQRQIVKLGMKIQHTLIGNIKIRFSCRGSNRLFQSQSYLE